ncbi:MAG: hypothetical protein FJ295_19900, partial [Planctomycetes bacterium]|nr:hypothetical protein [Planctomycetota bacterium]
RRVIPRRVIPRRVIPRRVIPRRVIPRRVIPRRVIHRKIGQLAGRIMTRATRANLSRTRIESRGRVRIRTIHLATARNLRAMKPHRNEETTHHRRIRRVTTRGARDEILRVHRRRVRIAANRILKMARPVKTGVGGNRAAAKVRIKKGMTPPVRTAKPTKGQAQDRIPARGIPVRSPATSSRWRDRRGDPGKRLAAVPGRIPARGARKTRPLAGKMVDQT